MTAEFLRRGMYGFAMGDALGLPYEFEKEHQAMISDEMVSGGINQQDKGIWSDDTSLTLATITSLSGMYDLKSVMQSFDDYLYEGKFTPNGQAFGFGEETAAAIKHYHETGLYGDFGQDNPMGNGNGALMRIWPVAFYDYSADYTIENVIDDLTGLTHGQMKAKLASRFFVYFMRVLPRMRNVERALVQAIRAMNRQPAVQTLMRQLDMADFVIDEQNSPRMIVTKIKAQAASDLARTGYVLDTLNVILWAGLNFDHYAEAVKKVVSLGGDTDTNGALVGLIMSYLDEQFPDEWFTDLTAKNKIESVLILADESGKFD